MVLKKNRLWISLMILGLGLALYPKNVQAEPGIHPKAAKRIKKLYGNDCQVIVMHHPEDTSDLDALLRSDDRAWRLMDGRDTVAYLLSTRAKGRFDYFDYTVFYHPDLRISEVLVTAYRSEHGAAICQKKWLSQFQDYQGRNLKLGKDVDAVSGGTISALSLVEDLRRCFLLIEAWTGMGAQVRKAK